MKNSLVVFLLFVAAKIFAQQTEQPVQQQNNNSQLQQPPQQNSMYNNDMNYYGNKAAKFRRMKVKGIIRGSIGGGMLACGIFFLTNGLADKANGANLPNQPVVPSYTPKIVGGTVLTVVGALMLTGGALRAIIGAKKEKEMVMSNHRMSVFIAPTAFKIAYTF